MTRILVTGGAGFIGNHLISELLSDKENEIICMDNLDPFYSIKQKDINIKSFFNNPNFKFINGDIRNNADLNQIGSIDKIVHLAAKAGIRPSIDNAYLYYEVNVLGTQRLIDYAIKYNVKQFVFASSSSVYGINKNLPWEEEDITQPISPYASSKLSAESIGYVASHLYGIRFIALRLFTVYGPGQRPDLAIYKFVQASLKKKKIRIYGDGSSSRDYTYVKDVVNGIIQAMNYDLSLFEIINIGNSKQVTLLELVKAIECLTDSSIKVEFLPEQPGDAPHTCGNIIKAQHLLNYYPATKLSEGLKLFYSWFKGNIPINDSEH
ncbi:MAG: NAD-dependent epimerase/dehydratase family protein [Mucilaginibacter sp.]|uniref:NAD-dependent epimerase/dehydratase family protein n=1 Tax=Mucilaginibacter sp. TaxID=1882438 RepID=UPI003267F0F2